MIKTGLIITYTFIIIMATACGRGSSKEGAAAARETFTRSCAACHAEGGEGGRPPGGLRVPSLKREEALNHTDDQLFEKIYNGTSNMPAFKNTLTEEQIKGLVRLIREDIQGRKPSS